MSSTTTVGGELADGQYRLLAPVSAGVAPEDTERRLRTAAAIARERGGGLVVCYVATFARQTPLDAVPPDAPTLVTARETTAELIEFVTGMGVPVVGRIHLTHEESRSVLDAATDYDCDGVMLAIDADHSQRRRLLGGAAIEKVVARVECEVFVEKQADEETPMERILLAVSGGPHSELAAQTARALAVDADAHVDVVHFLGEDATADERDDGAAIIEASESALFGVERVETHVERAENVAETIIARSDEYDVTVLGSPTSGLLEQFVFGTVPDSVNQRSTNAVVMAQGDTGSTSVYDRWIAGDPME
jgi:nucleotide-binding universal stress UspA family protein